MESMEGIKTCITVTCVARVGGGGGDSACERGGDARYLA